MPTDPTAPSAERETRPAGAGDSAAAVAESYETDRDKAIQEAGTTTETGDPDLATLGGPGTTSATPTVLTPAKRPVTGRYRSSKGPYRVDLRVDVDGPMSTMRVSADYYTVNGSTTVYSGSMRVDAASVDVAPTLITITGVGTYSWTVSAPRVKVTIPRAPVGSPPATAVLQHLNDAGDPTTTFPCNWESDHLRSVLFEQAREVTVTDPFVSYDTGSLPSGGPARTLSIVDAYAEAGIQLQTTGVTDVIDTSEAGTDQTWSDAELHAAMVNHCSLWQDIPQWAVWLFHAHLHDLGEGLLGIMFDQAGRQRQGAAVFYAGLAGESADKQRLQLFCCTHELGHSFNLLHSWQKSLGDPPTPNRPNAFSWMNYPWIFKAGGAAAFWSNFGFAFDIPELIHLRHGFRDDVIPGGSPFATGSALEAEEGWNDPLEDTSGLRLQLTAPSSFSYGEPVAVDLELTARNSQRVPSQLRPHNGTVQIAIRQPAGRTVVYTPLLHQCWIDESTTLGPDAPPVVDSAFIHYGAEGFYFDTPGRYRLRARMVSADGSIVMSNVVDIRVQPPLQLDDVGAAELLFGDEQGTLMYLVGSDFDGLRAGNDALSELRERYATHPLAQVARVVQGTNAAREFKTVRPNNTVSVRKPDLTEATELLAPVLDVAAARRAAPKRAEPYIIRGMVANYLSMPETHRDEGQIGAYIKSRRREIAVELGGRGL